MQRIPLPLLAAISLLFALPAYSGQTIYCESKSELAKHEGEYARKDIWDSLRTAKDWKALSGVISHNANIISITIPTSGEFYGASNHWHEGASVCVKFDKSMLWAVDKPAPFANENLGATRDVGWVGPFVRVGPAFSEKRLYFNQLFGNKCFESNRGEQWCFGSGYIQVADSTYSAELVLDRSEMPDYGFSAIVKKRGNSSDQLWVFQRDGDGWQVFEEKMGFDARWADKSVRKPWRTLAVTPR